MLSMTDVRTGWCHVALAGVGDGLPNKNAEQMLCLKSDFRTTESRVFLTFYCLPDSYLLLKNI